MSGAPTPIPRQLQEFIARYVRSVEQVEVLCLFAADPARRFSVAEVQKTIQSSEKSIADCLENFRRNELLIEEPAGHYRLDPRNNDLAQGLVVAYRERRVTIIETIYSRPPDAIHDFADAFKLRKEK